jgi:hypothetical protein
MLRQALNRTSPAMVSLMVFLCGALLAGSGDQGRVVVVTTSGVPAYAEAVEGMGALKTDATTLIDLHSPDHDAVLQQIRNRTDAVIIAVGADALQAVAVLKPASPVVSTMMLHENETPPSAGSRSAPFRPAASVHLDLSMPALLAEIGSMFPGKYRLGVIRNPARASDFEALAAVKTNQLGFAVRGVDCSQPEELLPALLSLKGKVDYVLVFPDSALYNSATVKPLLLASIENRLPIIGFSASFVRSGAAIGLYPDFRDIGRQTAELAQSVLSKRLNHPVDEGPRKWMIAVNQRALRLLGLEHGPPLKAELVLLR